MDIFTPEEQEELMEYRNATFAYKELNYKRRRKIGKCPLTPHEVSRASEPLRRRHLRVTAMRYPATELLRNSRFAMD